LQKDLLRYRQQLPPTFRPDNPRKGSPPHGKEDRLSGKLKQIAPSFN
jgi:hypothetical protein